MKVTQVLPHLLFNADAVIHVVGDMTPTSEERYTVSIDTLKQNCVLRQVGDVVQISEELTCHESSQLKRYDQVLAVNGHVVTGMEDLPEELRSGKPGSCSAICQAVWPSLSAFWQPTALLLRSPHGYRIRIPPAEQGHIYFNRFISMVKVALMEEASAQEVIYANDPQVKVEILRGGSRLRRATHEGMDALAVELQNFTHELEKKTFLPLPSEIARCHHIGMHQSAALPAPNTDYDLVSHLMQIFMEELAIGVSLPLWRAVRENRLEECRKLLQEQADPNLSDGKGVTGLHIAAEARSVEVVKLLLAKGALSTERDHRGRTAAHCIPLRTDHITTELIEIFLTNAASLPLRDKAGVSVFERFYLWSLSAVNGEPYEPLCSALRGLAGKYLAGKLPELWLLGSQALGSNCPKSLSVTSQQRRLNIAGKMRTVHVLIPSPSQIHREPLLYLGFCHLLPWSLQEPAMRLLAVEQGCEVFCVGCEAVIPDLLREEADEEHTGEAFYNDLFHVIDALPLTHQFHVIDSTFGLGLPLLWKLMDRLSGVLAINPSWIFSTSGPAAQQLDRAEQLTQVARQRDVRQMSHMLYDFSIAPSLAKAFFSEPGDAVGVAELMDNAMHQQYQSALANASSSFWKMGVMHSWTLRNLTQVLNALPPWHPPRPVYVVLACGSHAPLGAVQNAAYNLQELMTGSMQVYLPHCSWLWHIEGIKPVEEVNELLGFVREDGTATASLTSMLVRKRRDLEAGKVSPRKQKTVCFSADLESIEPSGKLNRVFSA
ncbi:unnamed protein product [Effrenium voratum]|uniref:Uncharacterized protein n=1 Tax=Effrenium voratum TaxID=2562239 RepID=A0AA36MN54_9DINO|nr:unnamed protein product [Effrenium voratum]